MRRAVILAALCGCSAAQLPPPARALCYAAADQRAQVRVNAECSIADAGVAFAECPAHDEIMTQLQLEQEACK
jgi:hypothetical protein